MEGWGEEVASKGAVGGEGEKGKVERRWSGVVRAKIREGDGKAAKGMRMREMPGYAGPRLEGLVLLDEQLYAVEQVLLVHRSAFLVDVVDVAFDGVRRQSQFGGDVGARAALAEQF